MTKHTQGRLRVTRDPMHWDSLTTIEGGLVGVKKPFMPELLVQVGGDADVLKAEANARRLVACWNACEGISTTEIEAAARSGLIAYALQQVMKALKEVAEIFGEDWREGSTARRLGDRARAAIAKVESK